MSDPGVYKCSCQNCDEHLEYPVDYEGIEVACPHCGKGTFLQQPEAAANPSIPSTAAGPAPPAMGSHGRASAMPLASSEVVSGPDDPLADAQPQNTMQSVGAAAKDELDPFVCEGCGAAMMPGDMVCVECGDRRSTIRNWNTTMIFRVTAGIVLAFELLVLGLQWTTTGKPFGLREHSRHAVLVKLGLSHGDPNPGGTNAPSATVTKDPDLVLQDHTKKADKNNGTWWIHGTVKNVSQYTYLAVKVKFKLKDKANSVIPEADVSAYVQSIEPGKAWEFKVLMIDPDADGYEPILPIVGHR
jgi:hypothetical protein